MRGKGRRRLNDSETRSRDDGYNAELGYAKALTTGFRLLRMAENGDPADRVHTDAGARWLWESRDHGPQDWN